MEGLALNWFQWVEFRNPFTTWERFSRELRDRFRPTQEGMTLEELLYLRQVGLVTEYRSVFEALSATFVNIDDKSLRDIVVNGLNEVRAKVRVI